MSDIVKLGDKFEGFKEGELEDILSKIRKEESFKQLDPKLKEAVRDGVGYLIKIHLIGGKVQVQDISNLRGTNESLESANEAFTRRVTEENDQTDRNYNKWPNDWFAVSTGELVDLAASDNRAGVRNDRVMGPANDYIRRLSRSGEFYIDLIKSVYPSNEREEMENYLRQERPTNIHSMNRILDRPLGDLLVGIGHIHADTKKD